MILPKKEILITHVEEGSKARKAGIEPRDYLLSVNNKTPRDLIDFTFWTSSPRLVLKIQKGDGTIREVKITKEEGEPTGLCFDDAVFDGIKRCRNKCLFCFVDQMPPDVRETLKIKDDDYRLSFLQGSYITLNNLNPQDWRRIEKLRLSPLYVSVHVTDPVIRGKLLGLRSPAPVLPDLQRLRDMGVQFHVQLVIVPGINDGENLEKTILDLVEFYPALRSIAIVPVGLTKYREGLPKIRALTKDEALTIIKLSKKKHKEYREKYGEGLVFAADELFIKAGLTVPADEYYEDYPQLSNGVGLLRLFMTEFKRFSRSLSFKMARPVKIDIITGVSTKDLWPQVLARLEKVEGLEVKVYPVVNRFFGPEVTVTGLLTGSDLLHELNRHEPGDYTFIPSVMLKAGEPLFLDGLSVEYVSRMTGRRIKVVPSTAEGLLQGIRDLHL